jgi:hypothetical protein
VCTFFEPLQLRESARTVSRVMRRTFDRVPDAGVSVAVASRALHSHTPAMTTLGIRVRFMTTPRSVSYGVCLEMKNRAASELAARWSGPLKFV